MIIFKDDDIVAINKPSGLLTHPQKENPGEATAMSLTRNLVGTHVFPVHRLDRGTSGVLVFALNKIAAEGISKQFRNRSLKKEYLALVRGWLASEYEVTKSIKTSNDVVEKASATRFEPKKYFEIPLPYGGVTNVGRYQSVRSTLVQCYPTTGRLHQIRRHLHHLSHPILGDSNYGDLRHNKFYRDILGKARLMLHCERLEFLHPTTGNQIRFEAPAPLEFDLCLWECAGLKR